MNTNDFKLKQVRQRWGKNAVRVSWYPKAFCPALKNTGAAFSSVSTLLVTRPPSVTHSSFTTVKHSLMFAAGFVLDVINIINKWSNPAPVQMRMCWAGMCYHDSSTWSLSATAIRLRCEQSWSNPPAEGDGCHTQHAAFTEVTPPLGQNFDFCIAFQRCKSRTKCNVIIQTEVALQDIR